jgi:hypothetical protein
MTAPVGISALQRVEALVANPALYAFATVVPVQRRSDGGRPRHYPPFMWVLYDALLSVYGSGRQVEAELAHPLIWGRLRDMIRSRFPTEPEMWLPVTPMRRHHYLYGRTRYLTSPDVLDRLGAIHREHATIQARQLGLLDPDGGGSWTHPDLGRVIHGDGKVITPLFKAKPGDRIVNKTTGEVHYPRVEPSASLHIEGTGEAAWGCKYVIAATRGTTVNARIILDVAYVATSGGEAAQAVTIFTRLAPLVPGAQAVIYDGALRGVHHQTLMRDHGLLTVNKVAAHTGVRNKTNKGRERVEKTCYVETKTIATPTGPADIRIFATAGQIGVTELTDTGQTTFIPLARIRTHRTPTKTGLYRWYNDYRLPDTLGAGVLTIRLHANQDDTQRRFNRTENVRPIPADDPDFTRLYGRRNDAESINRHLDDTLWLRRAHTIGHHRQTLNLYTYALGINAIATQLHQHQRHPKAA